MMRTAIVFLSLCTMWSAAVAAPPAVDLNPAGLPQLRSAAYIIVSERTGEVLFEQHSEKAAPIASITKLMTAMVILDARQRLTDQLTVTSEDIDQLKGTGSRLSVGTRMSREEMLNLMLMSSENRAASALARHYPGGRKAFIEAMNIKARMLGLKHTRFADSSGLDPRNISSPRDLVRMVSASASYPLIREFSTQSERFVRLGGRMERFGNSNPLVRDSEWKVGLSKTGFIREAGRCLVMQTWVRGEPVVMVLLNSEGTWTRTADAKRVRTWLETTGSDRLIALASGRGG